MRKRKVNGEIKQFLYNELQMVAYAIVVTLDPKKTSPKTSLHISFPNLNIYYKEQR